MTLLSLLHYSLKTATIKKFKRTIKHVLGKKRILSSVSFVSFKLFFIIFNYFFKVKRLKRISKIHIHNTFTELKR